MSEGLHLVAHVAGRGVLFDVGVVDSVVDVPQVVPVPGARAAVRGLAALRSRVATVLDLRTLLGLPRDDAAAHAGARAVVTLVDGHLYAFVVDTLEEVAEFACEPPPGGVAFGASWRSAAAIAEGAGETLVVLDPARLVDAALSEQLH